MRRISLLLALVLLLAGCGAAAVRVPVPPPDAAADRFCAALKLPATVHGQKIRTTDPKSPLVAAWGDPAIALRCGVPRPSAALRGLTSQLVTLNGVNWLPSSADRPVTFTAVGRQAYVEVTVPATYTRDNPAGDVLIELTTAIKAAVPEKPDGAL